MTCIVRRAKLKEMSCDILNKGNLFLIRGRALLTRVVAIAFLQESGGKVYFVFQEQQKEHQRRVRPLDASSIFIFFLHLATR